MNKKSLILVVDDDSGHRTMLKTLLSGWGYGIFDADDGSEAVRMVKKRSFDVVLMDLKMIKMSGMEALSKIHSYTPSVPVVIMTAFSSVDTAVEALKKGAYDYLTKPLDFEKLKLTIERIIESKYLKEENRNLRDRISSRFKRENIIGSSLAMTRLLETVEMAAPSDANILVSGESGTGKELVAGAVHYNSPRKNAPFIKINCAAITETLLESELFGHEKGSFTGADKSKNGKFVQAHSGSILLDEISEMNTAMQAKLLRVIQEREVTPVGSEKTVKVDVRVIASTNRDLKELTDKKKFREDLFFRLNVVNLEVPSLRDRKEDIPELAIHFLKNFSSKNKKNVKGFTPDAMDALIKYSWPGNVRELMNTVERAVVLARSEYLSLDDFPVIYHKEDMRSDNIIQTVSGDMPLFEVEKAAVIKTLESSDGNRSEAARRLGITRKTLLKKLKQYGVAK
ncbi:MAG: sigma-54-dependent Fis family transcriptional regulator [Deltaproteobacteria bacterium]|nr:sigma-54-dependent Fis family transcriptional regulator [Deltaproteobacteria bacterium]